MNMEALSTLNETSIFLVSLILAFVFYYIFKKRNSKRFRLPPGPVGLPILGYYPFITSDAHLKFRELSKKYGNIFSLYIGRNLTVVVNEWSVTEELFNKMEIANRPTGIFDALPNGFGHGGVNGKEWTDQRRLTVKTMRDVGLGRPQWEHLLQEEVVDIIQEIRNSKGQVLDIRQILASTFTLNLMTLIFGHQLPSTDPAVKYLSNAVDFIMENFPVMSFSNYSRGLTNFLNKLGLYGSREVQQKLAEFSTFVKEYVDSEMKDHEKDDGSFVGIYHREVEQQKNNTNTFITERSLYGNVQVLILGGTETTRSAAVFLIRAVALHPDVQTKIHKELDSVLGQTVSWAERAKVPYTYSTILESLRWDTLTPVNTLRMTNEDIQIQGYDIPKGTYILMNQWALHNDPEYWPEPQKFKPERFLSEDGTQLKSKTPSFVPFSIGRRSCPGKMIALTEIFKYFVSIMQNFTVLPPEDGRLPRESVLGLTYQATSLKVRFIPREAGSEKLLDTIEHHYSVCV